MVAATSEPAEDLTNFGGDDEPPQVEIGRSCVGRAAGRFSCVSSPLSCLAAWTEGDANRVLPSGALLGPFSIAPGDES